MKWELFPKYRILILLSVFASTKWSFWRGLTFKPFYVAPAHGRNAMELPLWFHPIILTLYF